MSEEMRFYIYLLESYASYRGISTGTALREWEEHGIEQEIYDNYWGYHTESLENAFKDIDSLIKTGKHAF